MNRIIVFGKAPAAGKVKTRLIPRLGPEGAAAFHAALIRRSLRVARAAALGPLELCSDGWNDALDGLAREFGAEPTDQGAGDIGVRMARALARSPGAILVGTDNVALEAGHLRAAAARLAELDAVFGPTEDGGYLLVGMARMRPEAFENIDWSTERVMTQTRARLAASGASWSELPVLWDIDRPEDYDRMVEAGVGVG